MNGYQYSVLSVLLTGLLWRHILLWACILNTVNAVFKYSKYLAYCDYPGDNSSEGLYWDRLVAIRYFTNQTHFSNQGIGVLINKNHLLTSFNPFRMLSHQKQLRNKITVQLLTGRIVKERYAHSYTKMYSKITCARQVIPLRKRDLTADQWHGTDGRHSPVHDLMAMRLTTSMRFLHPKKVPTFEDIYKKWSTTNIYKYGGPLKTDIAKPDDFLGGEMKFATLGFENFKHIAHNGKVYFREYSDENVQVNCEEWLPRDWGHFICLRNDDTYPAMVSGAMLVYDDAVFGVGSFVLKKANSSILVFTDVRPYHDLIFKTCTTDDGGPL